MTLFLRSFDNASGNWGALFSGEENCVLFTITLLFLVTLSTYYYMLPSYLCFKATRELKDGNLEVASNLFAKAVKISPRDARLWFGFALTLRGLERWNEAIDALTVVENLEPFQFSALTERVFVLRAQKRFEDALNELTHWIEREECPEEAWLMRSAIEIEIQRFESAEKDCNYLIEIGSETLAAEAFNNRGVARLMLGRESEAESDFETSYLLDPRSSNARAYCASFWLRRDMPLKTLALCEATVKTDPFCAVAYFYRGLAKRAIGDEDGAEEDLLKANELKKGSLALSKRILSE